ncbi:MAG TPA: type VI secretion system tube protein Hcp [Candidatus Dormibacteraeota bacterium]|nr:type VI secretion system tube protein Hcp [Candidatus Dormibacteraeota bacterium]
MAAVDYFLKIDGIQGESLDSKHKNEIDIESWSWHENNDGSHAYGSGGGAGKVTVGDFSFAMRVNKASPKLFLACATGDHIKEALLTCRKAGKEQQEYLKIKFSDLLISSYQSGGSKSEVVPVDSITFNFSKIEFTYAHQDEKGKLGSPVVHNYDLKQNKGA